MKKLFVIAVVLLVASCKGGEAVPDAEGVKTVYLEPLVGSEQVVKLSEVASKVLYIPLETNQESLVGNVIHANIENNVIYLPDYRINKLNRFSLEGKYLGSVGRQGRAFGEFLEMSGFSFDYDYETGAEMLVDAPIVRKFIEYHTDGAIREVKLDNFGDKSFNCSFMKKNGEMYVCSIFRLDPKIQDLIFLDKDGNLIGEFPDGYEIAKYKKANNPGSGEERPVAGFTVRDLPMAYRNKDFLMIVDGNHEKIISYKPNDTTGYLSYVIDYGQFMIEENNARESALKLISAFTKESKTHLFLTFNFGILTSENNPEKLTRVLFDKSTGEAKSLLGRLENDIDGGPSFWPLHVSRDGQMIAIIQAIDFIEAAKECNSAEMKSIAATLTDESNPVIMLVTE